MAIRSILFVLAPDETHNIKEVCFSAHVMSGVRRDLEANGTQFNKVAWIKALREKHPMSLVNAKYIIESLMIACNATEEVSQPTPADLLELGSWSE